jgi:uncharacterized protein (DUF1330 family)
MAAYMIVRLKFGNLDWVKDYLTHVPAMVREFGGEYLVRSTAIAQIEGPGDLPDQVVILTFPSIVAIRAFMAHPAYAPYRDARIAATESDILAIEG